LVGCNILLAVEELDRYSFLEDAAWEKPLTKLAFIKAPRKEKPKFKAKEKGGKLM